MNTESNNGNLPDFQQEKLELVKDPKALAPTGPLVAVKPPKSDIFWMTLDDIEVEEGFNAREDYGDLEELANSIIENGIKMPLRGFTKRGSGKIILTDGHRRHAATKLAFERGFTDIRLPIMKEGQAPSMEERTIGLIIYNEGKRLTLLEEATVYSRLISYGWSVAQISSRVGKSDTFVADALKLMSISTTMRKLITDGKISASAVIDQLRSKDATQVEREVKKAVDENAGKKVTAKHLPTSKPKTNPNAKIVESILNELNNRSTTNDKGTFVAWDDIADVIKKEFGVV